MPSKTCALKFASQQGYVRQNREILAISLGNWESVGNEVSEMRIAFGPGYRLYFTRRESVLIIMLAGGDKSTQSRDITRAQRILKQLELD